MKIQFHAGLALIAGLLLACSAGAQDPALVRIIVPSPAGGLSDAFARVLAAPLKDIAGQLYIVENRPGASTSIGMAECGRAPPDGRTFCLTLADSLAYNPHVFKRLPYDADRFLGVAHLGWSNGLIVVNSNAEFSTYREMLAHAKKRPRTIFWATWGDASLPDVFLRWTNLKAGVEIEAVPYKGGAPANQSILAAETQVTYMGIGLSRQHVLKGTIRPVAATGKSRSALYPDVPTLQEMNLDPGLPGYFGLYAPPGTPTAILRAMHDHVQKALDTPALQRFLETYTLERSNMNQAQFDQFIRNDRKRAGEVFRQLGFNPAPVAE